MPFNPHCSLMGSTGTGETSHDKNSCTKIEPSLSQKEELLMTSDDIIQCLFSAAENWEMMDKASPLTSPVRLHPYTLNAYCVVTIQLVNL